MEPEDEGVYLRRKKRHIHHRSAENPAVIQRSCKVRDAAGPCWAGFPVRWPEAPGPGCSGRRGEAVRAVLREPPMAGRPADKFPDGPEVYPTLKRYRSHADGWTVRAVDQERATWARARTFGPGEE